MVGLAEESGVGGGVAVAEWKLDWLSWFSIALNEVA
jgi:hypothetical protein